jgi:hypothetical protein
VLELREESRRSGRGGEAKGARNSEESTVIRDRPVPTPSGLNRTSRAVIEKFATGRSPTALNKSGVRRIVVSLVRVWISVFVARQLRETDASDQVAKAG